MSKINRLTWVKRNKFLLPNVSFLLPSSISINSYLFKSYDKKNIEFDCVIIKKEIVIQ